MFTEERIGEILRQLETLRHPAECPAEGWQMQKRPGESRPLPGDGAGAWQPIPAGGIWGGHCEYFAFRGELTVPMEYDGKAVDFSLTTGREKFWDATNPQFTVYVNGELRQGFDVNHNDIRLTDCAKGGETYSLFLSAYTGVQNFHLYFAPVLRVVDLPVEHYYYDLLIPWQISTMLERDANEYRELNALLKESVGALDLRKSGSSAYYASVEQADAILRRGLYDGERDTGASVCCVGHTHIDVAWKWTLSVTEDKAVRSFSTVLELMRRYPEYIFMSSQPQLYLYVKKNAPEIYEQIRARVAEGRWEPEGGMFVEPDCNLASGEALARQLLYGKRFFKEEFGKDNQILWLPDVFGYSAALPQMMKESGIRYFMTTKIGWNEVNCQPYDTFYWKGIDGTKILTHFIPTRDYVLTGGSVNKTSTEYRGNFASTYNGRINPSQIKGAWQRYQQKELNQTVLCSYGYGDGGGGPSIPMLESQRRLAHGVPGCPKTKQSTALEFFRTLEKEIEGKKTPIWSGELYLEYHRGTYTSMARNKRYNRRSEFAMTDTETGLLLQRDLLKAPYPAEMIRDYWEILMRNQFHDILPGSSIKEVYDDSKEEYETLLSFTEKTQADALQAIADAVGDTVVFNMNGQAVSGPVALPKAAEHKALQLGADGTALAWAKDVPAKGYTVLTGECDDLAGVEISASRIETPFAIIDINDRGQISAWFDKRAGRQLLKDGCCGNVLMTYEDKPFKYDNWNIQDYYKEKSWPVTDIVSAEVIERGPLRYALKMTWRYQDSLIDETVYVYPNNPRVDFAFHTDWKEDQILLKTLFPLELNATEATYEIQYGNVKRGTTQNTSWDMARFEVCHHKWMDISEGGFGVSFLNDCKYGVGVEENEVGLSLLKCGREPNPEADREEHFATYSVLPHTGTWQEADVVRQAYILNNPLVCFHGKGEGILPERYGLVCADDRNIMIEAVKRAEDSEATVVRFYEFENRQTDVTLRFARPMGSIYRSNIMEERKELLARDTDSVTLTVKPFQIVTLLLEEKE